MSIHDDGFIFNDPRYLADMSAADKRELRLFVGGPLADELPESENEMATKTTTKTTKTAKTTTKETTVTKPSFYDRNAQQTAARIKLQQEIQTAVSEPTIPAVTSCLPGKGPKNLCDDPVELELLRYAATYYGWTTNEFCTVSQAKKFGGTLIEGSQGFDLLWKPKTIQSGKNAGKTSQWISTVYPADCFVWANGAPDDHDYKVAQAEKKVRKAQRDLKTLTTPKAKTKAQVQAENDALQAQLKAQAEQMAQLQAMMAQLMAAQTKTA